MARMYYKQPLNMIYYIIVQYSIDLVMSSYRIYCIFSHHRSDGGKKPFAPNRTASQDTILMGFHLEFFWQSGPKIHEHTLHVDTSTLDFNRPFFLGLALVAVAQLQKTIKNK